MAEITRYVVVDRDDNESAHEYDEHEYDEAVALADQTRGAVIARKYEYTDSELVYTYNGAATWPPKARTSRRRS